MPLTVSKMKKRGGAEELESQIRALRANRTLAIESEKLKFLPCGAMPPFDNEAFNRACWAKYLEKWKPSCFLKNFNSSDWQKFWDEVKVVVETGLEEI
ncbi:hypothetical protein RJT34_13725 [Clitoria ternatea]|uniref:Uncharacterized protein n=1 Tax=Clitoria ternatea TaxID=43366 RepID=A0AAN9JPG5_CLITE